MIKNLKVAALVTAALMLGACSSPKHEPAELIKFTPGINVTQVWSKSLSSSDAFIYPAVSSYSAYVGGGKWLYRLDADDGKQEWEAKFDNVITGGVGSDGYYTAVSTDDGMLHLVDGEGKTLWTKSLTAKLQGPPVIAHDIVFVKTADTRVTAIEAATGDQKWTYQRTQPALTLRAPTKMAAEGNLLFVGQANGTVVLLDQATGQPVFEFPVGQPSGITEVERLIDVIGTPVANGNLLCAAAYQGSLTCIDNQTGQLAWTKKADSVGGPAIDPDNVYVVEANGTVKAFYRESGELRWTNDRMKYRSLTTPVVVPGAVAIGDFEGYIHFLSPRTGEEIGRTKLSGAIVVPPVAYGNGAIFQTQKGQVAYIVTR